MINRANYFFQSVHPGVSGKGSNFAIFGVYRGWPLQLLYYRATVITFRIFNVHWLSINWNRIGNNLIRIELESN